MIYNLNVLNQTELKTVKSLIVQYKYHDKIDLIIEMSVDDPKEVRKRNYNKKKKKEIKTQSAPAEILYCDSDRCEIDYSHNNKSSC